METDQGWKIVWDPFSHPNSDNSKGSGQPSGTAASDPAPEDGSGHGIGHLLHSLARVFSLPHATPRPSSDGGQRAQRNEQQQEQKQQQQQQGMAPVQVPQRLSAAAHRRSIGGHQPTIQEEFTYRDGMPKMELDPAGSDLLSPFASLAQVGCPPARLPFRPPALACACVSPQVRQLVWRPAALGLCLHLAVVLV
jgi:hypothetical protein